MVEQNTEIAELNLEELYTTYTSDEQIKESYERRTVPTGRYTYNPKKAAARLMPENSPFPGRKTGSFFGQLMDDQGARKGSLGFDASWEVHRRDNGKMDSLAVLWGQLVTALDLKSKPVGDVIVAAGQYPLSIYVTESFKTPTGWQTARTMEERAELRKAGYDARNFVQSISRVR